MHRAIQRVLPLATIVAMLTSLMLVLPVLAAPTSFTTGLTGAQEVPGPGDTDGSGTASVIVDSSAASGAQLCYTLNVSNIVTATAAHIHEGAPGVAGPVVVTLLAPAAGTSAGCAADGDFNLVNSGDPDIATLVADIAANPGNYYANVHNADFPDGAVRGQLAGMVMVMKHLCNSAIQSEADFMAVEAKAATNPTTPMGVPSLGATTETVLACPTIVQPGDTQTPGALASGSMAFDFSLSAGATIQTLSTDTTFSGDNGFSTLVEDFACEDTVGYDANRNGAVESTPCLDFSSYAFGNVLEGSVTVRETSAPPGARFGTVRLSPPEISDDASIGLTFTPQDPNGVITFNSAADSNAMVTLHVYNFLNVAAATPTPTPVATATPKASSLPNTNVSDDAGGSLPLAPIMAIILVGGAGTLAALRVRRSRLAR